MYTYEKPDNLIDLFERTVNKFPERNLFLVNTEKNPLEPMTYREVSDRIDNLRACMAGIGVKKNDIVGIISKNRPEWVIIEFAALGCGATFVPMYEKELYSTWKYIIRDTGLKVLFVADDEIYDQVSGLVDEIPTLEKIFIIDSEQENSLSALEKTGKGNTVAPHRADPYDTAFIIYTSGTTGEPKGVELTHGNLTYCSRSGYKIYPELNENLVALTILPWAHSYALSGELHNWLQFGGSMGFVEDVTTLMEDLQRVRPHFLICVPRLFNKIYDGIHAKMDEAGGLKKKLFAAACSTAKLKRELAQQGKSSILTNFRFFLLDRLVFSKIRKGFGNRLKGSLTASAATNVEIANFYYDLGIPIYDCYGLSETSPAVTMNCKAAHRLGSVGRVLEGQTVAIDTSVVEDGADDGEIIVYGPNIMKGYYNKPEETAKVIQPDGGFRTGDRGRFDEDGYLYITGRIKEQYKLENGKYVFPAGIEEEIRLLPSIANAMIYGEGRPYNVCLVYPDFEALNKQILKQGLPTSPEELVRVPEFTDMLEKQITEFLKKTYGGYEIPKKYHFLCEDFSLDNGMLTQTMKLKRREVISFYEKEINALYA